MIHPSYLQKEDTVAIVSTARKISSDKIIPAIKLLEKWGLNVSIGETIGSEENQAKCAKDKVTSYPYWKFKNGKDARGYLPLEKLAEISGCGN